METKVYVIKDSLKGYTQTTTVSENPLAEIRSRLLVDKLEADTWYNESMQNRADERYTDVTTWFEEHHVNDLQIGESLIYNYISVECKAAV